MFPIVSHRNALFLNNEVAEVEVPEDIVALVAEIMGKMSNKANEM